MKKLFIIMSLIFGSAMGWAQEKETIVHKTIGVVIGTEEVDVLVDCKNRVIEPASSPLADTACGASASKRFLTYVELPSKEKITYLSLTKQAAGFKLIVVKYKDGKWGVH